MWGLSTHGTHLHDRIISLRWEFLNHKSSIAPLLFIEMSVASQESERSCICVLKVSESERSCICVLEVSSQESERSCICVLEVSSQESERSCICVLEVSSQESERSFICVLWYWFLLLSKILLLILELFRQCGIFLLFILFEEEFEDTKGAIRIRISKKNRQHSGQKKKYKRTNNDLQNIHIKLKID
jgi:hypothetical protein